MSPRPLNIGHVHAAKDVTVTMHQPGGASAIIVHTGRLLAAVLRDNRLHHYRVSIGEGLVLLAPPSWLPAHSRAAVREAGLPLPVPVRLAYLPTRAGAVP